MLNWQQVLDFANQGNPKPEREVTRSDEEWRTLLDEQQYYVMRQHGTERAFLMRCVSCLSRVYTNVPVAKPCYLIRQPNLIQAQAGLVFAASQIQCHFLPYGSKLSACSSGSAL